MQLFIGNVSRQNLTFCFRVPEEQGIKQVMIPPGSQRQIYSPNLTKQQVDGIIDQGRIYGMVAADEVDRARQQTPMVYSVGKEISFAKIQKLMVTNHDALLRQGDQTRKEAAIISHHNIENPNSDVHFDKVADVEISEVKTARGPDIEIDDHMRVSRDPSEQARGPVQTARRGRKN